MTRVSIAALALGILVGSAAEARASTDDCMCVLAQPDWAPVEWERAPQSVEIGPFFSSDGSFLVSRAELERQAPPRSPTPVLWCASPDDPRCSGGDGPPDRGPRTGDASHGAATHESDDARFGPPAPSTRLAFAPGGGPSAGARHRIDRPPQR